MQTSPQNEIPLTVQQLDENFPKVALPLSTPHRILPDPWFSVPKNSDVKGASWNRFHLTSEARPTSRSQIGDSTPKMRLRKERSGENGGEREKKESSAQVVSSIFWRISRRGSKVGGERRKRVLMEHLTLWRSIPPRSRLEASSPPLSSLSPRVRK